MVDNIKEEIEDKVIDCINSGAGGRLVIFKPEKIDLPAQAGKDLVVEKRGDYAKKKISLNIYLKKILGKEEISVVPDKNFYLVFVDFDIIKQDFSDNFLVIPSIDLWKLKGKNDFSKYIINKNDFARYLMSVL